jgi:hypothetical protein
MTNNQINQFYDEQRCGFCLFTTLLFSGFETFPVVLNKHQKLGLDKTTSAALTFMRKQVLSPNIFA